MLLPFRYLFSVAIFSTESYVKVNVLKYIQTFVDITTKEEEIDCRFFLV